MRFRLRLPDGSQHPFRVVTRNTSTDEFENVTLVCGEWVADAGRVLPVQDSDVPVRDVPVCGGDRFRLRLCEFGTANRDNVLKN